MCTTLSQASTLRARKAPKAQLKVTNLRREIYYNISCFKKFGVGSWKFSSNTQNQPMSSIYSLWLGEVESIEMASLCPDTFHKTSRAFHQRDRHMQKLRSPFEFRVRTRSRTSSSQQCMAWIGLCKGLTKRGFLFSFKEVIKICWLALLWSPSYVQRSVETSILCWLGERHLYNYSSGCKWNVADTQVEWRHGHLFFLIVFQQAKSKVHRNPSRISSVCIENAGKYYH